MDIDNDTTSADNDLEPTSAAADGRQSRTDPDSNLPEDDIPEAAFSMVGNIEQAIEKAKTL